MNGLHPDLQDREYTTAERGEGERRGGEGVWLSHRCC